LFMQQILHRRAAAHRRRHGPRWSESRNVPGNPDVWLRDYAVREHVYWQTFTAKSRHLCGLMAFGVDLL